MEQDICYNCGSSEFIVKEEYKICKYCNSKFKIEINKNNDTVISLQNDIDVLLQKCKDEPYNSRKYASLILDIDPTNREAKKYVV